MMIFSELSEAIERGAAERVTRWAYNVLDEIITGRRSVNAVSHPLGFLCLPINRLGDEGVCVHLWEAQRQRASLTTSPMHCHGWELLSWVLAGELRNRTLQLTDDTQAPTHRVFEVHSNAEGDEIRATRRLVQPEVTVDTTHRAGEWYRLPAGVFHQTIVPDAEKTVATVALGLTKAGAVDLSLGGIHTTSHQVRRQLCDRRDTVKAADSVRNAFVGRRG